MGHNNLPVKENIHVTIYSSNNVDKNISSIAIGQAVFRCFAELYPPR